MSSAATSKEHISMYRECELQRAITTSRPALPSPGIRTAIRGTLLPLARLTGGCRFMRSSQTTRWPFTRNTGPSRSRITPQNTIIIFGTSCIAAGGHRRCREQARVVFAAAVLVSSIFMASFGYDRIHLASMCGGVQWLAKS